MPEEVLVDNIGATFCIEGILLPLIGCVGICGNIASISHFGTPFNYRQNFQSYMLCLGVVDLLLILCSLVVHSGREFTRLSDFFYEKTYLDMISELYQLNNTSIEEYEDSNYAIDTFQVNRYHLLHCVFIQVLIFVTALYSICVSGNIYLHLAISIERYLVVCRPLSRIRRNKYQPRIFIFLIVIISSLYNVPKFFEWQLIYRQINLSENSTSQGTSDYWDHNILHVIDICPTKLRQNQIYIHVMMWANFFLMSLIPYVLICLLNVSIIKQLIRQNQWASKSNHQNTRRKTNCGAASSMRKNIDFEEESKYCMPTVHYHSGKQKRNDVLLAKLSLAIMVPYLIYHTVRMIPNLYELTRVKNKLLHNTYFRVHH